MSEGQPVESDIAPLDREELTGIPGMRIPHLCLDRNSQRISTMDQLDGSFILLAGSDCQAWCKAAAGVATSLRMKLAAYRIGSDGELHEPEQNWSQKFGGVVCGSGSGPAGWFCSVARRRWHNLP
jgi:hypothetical protein